MKQSNKGHLDACKKMGGLALLLVFMKVGFAKPPERKEILTRDATPTKTDYFETHDTIFYASVCCWNGKTYLKTEAASLEGIKEWKEGRCCDYTTEIKNRFDTYWISSVVVNGMSNVSGAEEKGYSNFTKLIFDLSNRKKNAISLKGSETAGLAWRVRVDFNENARFEKSELALNSDAGEKGEGSFFISPKIEAGLLTRMRVWRGVPESEATKSSTEAVEDYTLQIAGLGQENIDSNKKAVGNTSSRCEYFHVFMKFFGAIKIKI